MFKIDQHIEHLLLNHDCVIVPGFGGFVVHDIPARFDFNDGMMLPPTSTVGFNPQLTLNDSLLIQSFVEAYDMSYPEAQREVERETEDMKGLIADNNSLEIHSVGIISINADGNYEFEPYKAGILVPRLYGFSGIDTNDNETFAILHKPIAKEVNQIAGDLQEYNVEEEDNDEKVLSITAKTIKRIAVACAIVMFLAAIPFIAKNDDTRQMLSSIDLSFLTKLQPTNEVKKSEMTTKEIIPTTVILKKKVLDTKSGYAETEKIETEEKENKRTALEQKTNIQSEAKPIGPTYAVVLAAHVSQKNADNYVETLKKNGYKDVRVIGKGKGRKVIIGTYENKVDANKYKRQLAVIEEFSAAWVVEIK